MSTGAQAGAAALEALERLPGVAEQVARSRRSFEALRWHPALRRRVAEVAGEGRIRGAQASAALEGARVPLGQLRELAVGLRPWRADDPFHRVLQAALAATSVTAGTSLDAPAQVAARLHTAATGAGVEPVPEHRVGRPRGADDPAPRELADLGPAPEAAVARARLDQALDLVGSGAGPALLVGAVVHAELAVARPFASGNALVGRALERLVHRVRGLDPLGVGVPEAGWWQGGIAAYVGALAAYDTGTPDGVALWLDAAGRAAVAGGVEGSRVADAVLRGSLAQTP